MATRQGVSQFGTSTQNIINGQDPAQKAAFFQGQVDPNQPLLYYDMEKEIAFVFLPNGLQLTTADQERIIGSLTNKLVNTLPNEQRKFYLLNPKPFLSLDSMVKAILEADGITEEDLQQQEARMRLLEEFFKTEDEAVLKAKIKENDEKLDRQFFELLTSAMQAAQVEGNQAGAQGLLGLRTFIARHSSQGKQAVKEIDEELGIVYVKTQDELLERLKQAQTDEELVSLVASGHAFLDYGFFQKLTGQIDAAIKAGDKEKEQTLTALRSKILEVKGRLEEQSQKVVQEAVEFLKQLLQSSDPVKVLEKNRKKINEAFFAVLSANIQEARQQKQEEAARAMEMLGNMAMSLIQAEAQAQSDAQPQPDETAPSKPESQIPTAKR